MRNPRLHLSGLAGLATGKGGSTSTATRLTVTGGSPSAPSLVGRTGWPGWTVSGNTLAPAGDGQADGATDGLGTLELAGTVTTVTFRVEERSTARAGSTTAPAALKHAYTVTLDEGLGTAPQGYGNASHLVSDLFLGQDTTGNPGRTPAEPIARNGQPLVSREPGSGAATLRDPRELDDVPSPLIDPDRGASRRSPFASPLPARNQPGRAEYQGADPTVTFPGEVAIGRYYELTVPVNPGSGPATLVGWIDFDHNGHFDATERVQAEVPAASTSARLEWTVPGNAASGETWARLRIARDPSQLVGPGGFADSGQVLDQRVKLTVGAARPEITGPVAGTVVAEARPEIRGYGAVAGAAVAVVEGDATLCRAKAGSDGAWTCRPERPLAPGEHRLVPVETTQGGVVLHGEPVKLTVKTAPPAAPALALPEFTNDPGLLFTGTADPGTTVSVTEASASPGAPRTGELCSTAVAADRTWSCLPVESLADGQHQVVATAVDAAGNRTPGRPVTLVVDTAAPERPTLASPASGALLTTARPRLTGRAEAAATVTVTARLGEDGDRFLLCSAQTAADGTWGCTATRDVAEGEFTVVVTATDRAGNGATGEPVTVKVRPPAAPVTPSAPATPSAPVSPTPAAPPPSAQSPGATAVQSAAPSATADATKDAAPAPTAVPAGLVGSASPAPARSAAPSAAVPTASGPAPVSNQLPAPTPTAGRPGAAAGTASAGSPGAPKGGAASSARALAALPESPEAVAARRTATGGWRSALCGGLFFLAGVGLLARRLVGRGPGLRRR
ncbi:hypothetical protein UK12_18310 [Saccharothrix sp. ST-888]|nr:hypothetical protein UK12_18310 [Saccharothrix sp. ST-888]